MKHLRKFLESQIIDDMINQIKDLFYILEDEGNKVNIVQTNQGGRLKSLELYIKNNKRKDIISTDYLDEFIDRCDEISRENGFYIYNLYNNRAFSGRDGEITITIRKESTLPQKIGNPIKIKW